MINCLARYNEIVVYMSTAGVLNSKGKLRKALVKKMEDGRDDTSGRFIRTSDMPGGVRALNEIGRREALAIVLNKIDTKVEERTDVTRTTLEIGVRKFTDAKRI